MPGIYADQVPSFYALLTWSCLHMSQTVHVLAKILKKTLTLRKRGRNFPKNLVSPYMRVAVLAELLCIFPLTTDLFQNRCKCNELMSLISFTPLWSSFSTIYLNSKSSGPKIWGPHHIGDEEDLQSLLVLDCGRASSDPRRHVGS